MHRFQMILEHPYYDSSSLLDQLMKTFVAALLVYDVHVILAPTIMEASDFGLVICELS